MTKKEQNYYFYLKRQGLAPKFERPGIYCIRLDGNIVYIGKSVNMLERMAQHYVQMNKPINHKYKILSDASELNHKIRFDVLYYANAQNKGAIREEIGKKEGELIRQYLPPLNYQIPKEENWQKYTTNPNALCITLDELIKKGISK